MALSARLEILLSRQGSMSEISYWGFSSVSRYWF